MEEFKDKKRPTKRKNNSIPKDWKRAKKSRVNEQVEKEASDQSPPCPKDGNQSILGGEASHQQTSHKGSLGGGKLVELRRRMEEELWNTWQQERN